MSTAANPAPHAGGPRPAKRFELDSHLAELAKAGPEAIQGRLDELAREWSAGRMTKATAGVMILSGLALGRSCGRLAAVLPLVGGAVLAQYLFTRRSWLGRVFHEIGFRSGAEIEHETLALRLLRGDFRHLPTVNDIEDDDAITRLEGEGGIVYESDERKMDSKEAIKQVVEATRR